MVRRRRWGAQVKAIRKAEDLATTSIKINGLDESDGWENYAV